MEHPPQHSQYKPQHNYLCVKGLGTAGEDVFQGRDLTGHKEKEIPGLLRVPSSAGKSQTTQQPTL